MVFLHYAAGSLYHVHKWSLAKTILWSFNTASYIDNFSLSPDELHFYIIANALDLVKINYLTGAFISST
jgi:hypothetical protein